MWRYSSALADEITRKWQQIRRKYKSRTLQKLENHEEQREKIKSRIYSNEITHVNTMQTNRTRCMKLGTCQLFLLNLVRNSAQILLAQSRCLAHSSGEFSTYRV